MKSLLNGCAAAAVLLGLATGARAEVVVNPVPFHRIPADPADAAAPAAKPPAPAAQVASAADDDVAQPAAVPAPQAGPAATAAAGPAEGTLDGQMAKLKAQAKTAAADPAPPAAAAPTANLERAEAEAPPPAPAQAKLEKAVLEIPAGEPASVQALIKVKAAAPPPALTPDEVAFFSALGRRITDAASVYESYVRRVGGIDPAFSGAASVQRAVRIGAAYQPKQLEEGVIAYAALIALRNPAFVEGVRSMPPAFAQHLAESPWAVLNAPGAGEAAADAAAVLHDQGEALVAAGKAITQAAYDVQTQAWSKAPVADPKAVLDGAKASAEQLLAATTPSKARLLKSLVATGPAPAPTAAPPPDVVRALALAALAMTGHTGDGKEAEFEALLNDPAGVNCLKMAKMNLNQCLAVAGPHYEDVFCTGRHAVSDTGQCVAAAALGGDPATAPPRLQEAVLGPEQASAYGLAAPDAEDTDDPVPAAAPRAPAAAPPTQSPPVQSYAEDPAPAPRQAPPQYSQAYAPNQAYAQNAYPGAYAGQGAAYGQGDAQRSYPQYYPYYQSYAYAPYYGR